MRRSAWTIGATVIAALSLGVAACGGSDNESGSGNAKGSDSTAATKVKEGAKQGGKLTVLWSGDVDHIDCGQTYYQMGYFICNATQKNLYAYKPDNGAQMVPDLADGDPGGSRGSLRDPRPRRRRAGRQQPLHGGAASGPVNRESS